MVRAIVMIVVASVMMCHTASALIETTDTSFLPSPPLLVTGYKTNSAGKDLDLVELYNTSDRLVDVRDWSIVDVANGRSLDVSSSYTGFLAPSHHIVAARDGVVSGMATFRVNGWVNTVAVPVKMTALRLQREGYRALDASFSTKAADIDTLMLRTYNTSSYSTAASPFETAYRKAWDDGLYIAPAAPTIQIVEIYPYSSDCPPNDTSILCGDYVKLQNIGSRSQLLDDLVLRTSSSSSSATSSNTFSLSGVLAPGDYYTVWQTNAGGRISLTNSGGYVWIEDMWGLEQYADTMTAYESADSSQQGYAYAQDDVALWQWTATPQPNGANTITPPVVILAPCPEGQYRNPDTNRCRKIEDVLSELSACEEGYERNPTTNRCRKLVTATTSSLTPCKEGQVRNPETNRCRSIASEVADLIPCNDGYERNPATNRCRKVQGGEVKGVQYPVEPIAQGSGNAAGLWTLVGVVAIAALYGVWEWRQEIGGGLQRLLWWRK